MWIWVLKDRKMFTFDNKITDYIVHRETHDTRLHVWALECMGECMRVHLRVCKREVCSDIYICAYIRSWMHAYMYVCMYACVCMWFVCKRARLRVCVCVCISEYVQARTMRAWVHANIRAGIYVFGFMYVCVYECMNKECFSRRYWKNNTIVVAPECLVRAPPPLTDFPQPYYQPRLNNC